MIRLFTPLLLTYLCAIIPLDCKDFGIQGELFAIEEESMISVLQKQLSSQFSQESLKKRFKEATERAKHPVPSRIIPNAHEPRIFYYDPTYTAPETITDPKGNVIVLKGTRFNPLKQIQLSSGLLFLDGDNPAHIQWAREQKGVFKWILVHGSPFELELQEKRPIYFDQNAFSSTKFQLQQIPARVTQEGSHLKIEEIVLKEPGDS